METLRNINLNLLPILHALLHQESVTEAGKVLNMSQSAVSDALANLRHVFNDEILVKSGRSMVLTDLARSLIPHVDEAIDGVHRLLSAPAFDPAVISTRFVVSAVDYIVMMIGPPVTAALREVAPSASLQFVNPSSSSVRQFAAGEIDLVIMPSDYVPAGTHRQVIYEEEFVCIMRKGHPLGRKTMTREEYWAASHASFRTDTAFNTTFEDFLLRREHASQFTAVRIPQFSLLPFFVQSTDLVAMVPRRVARLAQDTADIEIRELPFEGKQIPISMAWSELKHNEPSQRWFRNLLADVSIEIYPSP